MALKHLALGLVAVATAGCPGAPAAPALTGPKPLTGVEMLATDYRQFLDRGRTPAHAIEHVLAQGGWRVHDAAIPLGSLAAGTRLAFVDRSRTILLVVVGSKPLIDVGFRLVGAHIDTPAPRLVTTNLSRSSQASLRTRRYGGTKAFHWPNRPLAIVGSVATDSGERLIDLGLNDDFVFWATLRGKDLMVTTSSTPTGGKNGKGGKGGKGGFNSLVEELHRRYEITARDLENAELYVVPTEVAREVGLDRELIGAHGQDDRSNSYVAWRALADLKGTPEVTAMTWLVDREEVGSTGATGARSRFLELVTSNLLAAQKQKATEAVMHRLMSRVEILSSDTPACLNPNWPEAHEKLSAPRIGRGPAVFPYTGSRGKQGGGAASAELIAQVRNTFATANAPLQFGLLGHVDRGGGGTIAKYLSERGAEVLDLGVCVISMHSPFELVAKADLWSLYRGLTVWFGERARVERAP